MKVIVTGASRGIGRGIATVLAREGFQVGLLARSKDLLDALKQELTDAGGRCAAAPADLRDCESTRRAIDALASEMGGLDVLINNAGQVIPKSIFDLSLEEWHAMVETNVNGVFYATRAALPHLQKNGGGFVINVSSISGKWPLAGGSGYAATKFAVTGFSQSLFLELRDRNIKVATVYPGSVDSESHRHDPEQDHSWKVRPEDVGAACRDILRCPDPSLISEVEIRPARKPGKPQK